MQNTEPLHEAASPEDPKGAEANEARNKKLEYLVVYLAPGASGRCFVKRNQPIASGADVEGLELAIAASNPSLSWPVTVTNFQLLSPPDVPETPSAAGPMGVAVSRKLRDACRQEFEAYERARWDTSDFNRFSGGDYTSPSVQEAWEYWRDSRAQAPQLSEVQLAELALTGGFVDCLTDLPSNPDAAVRQIQDILVRYGRTVCRHVAPTTETEEDASHG